MSSSVTSSGNSNNIPPKYQTPNSPGQTADGKEQTASNPNNPGNPTTTEPRPPFPL